MRKFKIIIETGIAGGDFEDVFEVDDDATPDEIHDEAKEIRSSRGLAVMVSLEGLSPPFLQQDAIAMTSCCKPVQQRKA
ncbi:TPA: hypothetical protein JHJ73_000521 [Escherichia coli]|nr:hypothetical protein [Escherichia coli]